MEDEDGGLSLSGPKESTVTGAAAFFAMPFCVAMNIFISLWRPIYCAPLLVPCVVGCSWRRYTHS